jgi:penicillin-binding protein 1B
MRDRLRGLLSLIPRPNFPRRVPSPRFLANHSLRRISDRRHVGYILATLVTVLLGLSTVAFFKLRGAYNRYAAVVDQQIDRQALLRQTGIYAAPRRLNDDQQISQDELRERLLRAGYSQAPRGSQAPTRQEEGQSNSGDFDFAGDTVDVRTNEGIQSASLPKLLKIKLGKPSRNGARVVSLKDGETGHELKTVILPPELITTDGLTRMHPRSQASFKDFPPVLVKALIAIEDRHFFTHRGVDVKAVCRAMWENWRHGEIREGGSTITQQLIKTSFLTPERTYERKVTEAMMAVAIERRLSKEEIFTIYGNHVYLGQSGLTGVNGFKQAAQVFFGKDLQDLTLAESALIAGLVQAPNRYSPYTHPDVAVARRNTVLDAMVETGDISVEEADAAKEEKLAVNPPAKPDESAAQHFVDYLKREMANRNIDEKNQSNLTIQTTIDLDLQEAANAAVENHLKSLDRIFRRRPHGAKSGDGESGAPSSDAEPQAALIAVDPHTGAILAMVGGRNYAASQLNRVIDARRQPGSVFKPIVYAAALANGMSPDTVFDDSPHEFVFGNEVYRPQNFGGGFSNQQVTLREGIVRSLNVVAVEAAIRVGLPKVADFAQKMGMPRPDPYPSMALGSFEATPFEIAEAYTTFANNGVSVVPFGIKSYTNGETSEAQNTESEVKVLTASTAYAVTETLTDVVNRGTATRVRALGYRGPAAGKTGSSRDAWFAGYTPNLLVVVWVGFDDHRDLKMTGGDAAVPIWTDFIKRAFVARPDLNADDFTRPTGMEQVEIDPQTGMLANDSCPSRKTVTLSAAKLPAYCSKHPAAEPAGSPRNKLAYRASTDQSASFGRKNDAALEANSRRRPSRRAKLAPDSDSPGPQRMMSDGDETLPRVQPAIIKKPAEPVRKETPATVVAPTPAGTAAPKNEIKTESQPDVQPVGKTESKPAIKSEGKPETRSEGKPEGKPEAKPETKSESKPGAKKDEPPPNQ